MLQQRLLWLPQQRLQPQWPLQQRLLRQWLLQA